MTTYLGVGAVQVQTWITRTVSRLALLRGASIALSEHTDHQAVDAWLKVQGYRSRTAPDAGNVDGVVALAMADDEMATLPGALLTHLHRQLPGVQWEAWTANGTSYLDAYRRQAAGGGLAEFRLLPAVPELGIVRRCGSCGSEPAIQQETIGGDAEWLGADCLARLTSWRRAQSQDRAVAATLPGAQDWASIPGRWPTDLGTLAAKGGLPADGGGRTAVGRKDSRSHLALIAADGNGIGRLFERIAEANLPELRRNAVAELTEATREAVVAAARAFCADPEYKVVIPHYVGGDDVLLSVSAAAAWQVAAELGRQFERLAWRLRQHVPDGRVVPEELTAAIDDVGIGIGIVFAPRAHPVADAVPVSHRALAAAKALTAGGRSAIGWLDITYGAGADDLHAIELDKALADLRPDNRPDVFGLGPSARGALGVIVRGRTEGLAERVAEWSRRTGNPLTSLPAELPGLLSRARWWPNVSDDEEDRS